MATKSISSNVKILFINFFLCIYQLSALAQNTFPANGNAGINTNFPKYPLQINCGDFTGSLSDDQLGALYPNNGLLIRKSSGKMGASLYLQHDEIGGKRWGLTSGGSGNTAVGDFYITNFTNALDVMTLRPNGNVGIGVYFPSENLHVKGGARFEGVQSGGNVNSLVGIDANGKLWRYNLPQPLDYLTSSFTENPVGYITKFTSSKIITHSNIYDNGNFVGFATTTPTELLSVNGNISTISQFLVQDEAFKDNKKGITNTLVTISKLTPQSFTYKKNSSFNFDPAIVHYGIDMQSVKDNFPSLIKKSNGVESVNMQELIPITIQAVKEQSVEINLLKAEVDALKDSLKKYSAPEIDLLKSEVEELKNILKKYSNVITDKYFIVYPNPVRDENLYLSFISNKDLVSSEFIVTDLLGRTILTSKTASTGTHKINVGPFAKGIYLVTLINEKGKVLQTEKFIKY